MATAKVDGDAERLLHESIKNGHVVIACGKPDSHEIRELQPSLTLPLSCADQETCS